MNRYRSLKGRKAGILFALPVLCLLLFIGGCDRVGTVPPAPPVNSGTPTEEDPPEVTPPPAANVQEVVREGEFRDESDAVLVKYSVSFPYFDGTDGASQTINGYYDNMLIRYIENAQFYLFDMAGARKADTGESFEPYTARQSYITQLYENGYFSAVRVSEEYTGGAHETVTMYSESFEMENGGLLCLADLFSASESAYTQAILDFVGAEIEKRPGDYFENYKELAKSYDAANFFLSEQGLGVFFQVYDIAPYATGIPVFRIPYDTLKDLLKPEVYDALVS